MENGKNTSIVGLTLGIVGFVLGSLLVLATLGNGILAIILMLLITIILIGILGIVFATIAYLKQKSMTKTIVLGLIFSVFSVLFSLFFILQINQQLNAFSSVFAMDSEEETVDSFSEEEDLNELNNIDWDDEMNDAYNE